MSAMTIDPRPAAIVSLINALERKFPRRAVSATDRRTVIPFEVSPKVSFEYKENIGIVAIAQEDISAAEDCLIALPQEGTLSVQNDVYKSAEFTSLDSETTFILKNIVSQCKGKFDLLAMQGKFEALASNTLTLSILAMYAIADTEGHFAKHVLPTWPPLEEMKNHSLYWGSEELSAITSTYAHSRIIQNQKELRLAFDNVVFNVLHKQQISHHFVPSDENRSDDVLPDNVSLWNAFKYSFAVCTSRSHDGEFGCAEIHPLIDLFNGLPEQLGASINVELHLIDGSTSNSYHLYSTRGIAKGEELFISYGVIPGSGFVAKYGVMPLQMLDSKNNIVEPLMLWYPPSLAPDPSNSKLLKALKNVGYPASVQELASGFGFQLSPDMLTHYSSQINGVGSTISDPNYHEPDELKSLRQYLILAKVADDKAIELNLTTGRLKGDFDTTKIGKFLVKVVDYNLGKFKSENTSTEDLALIEGGSLTERMKNALRVRINYRESLLILRHAICRRYGSASFMDAGFNDEEAPKCLGDNGCTCCGRTVKVMACKGCSGSVAYCNRAHQKLH